jgi:hypothetical protein
MKEPIPDSHHLGEMLALRALDPTPDGAAIKAWEKRIPELQVTWKIEFCGCPHPFLRGRLYFFYIGGDVAPFFHFLDNHPNKGQPEKDGSLVSFWRGKDALALMQEAERRT